MFMFTRLPVTEEFLGATTLAFTICWNELFFVLSGNSIVLLARWSSFQCSSLWIFLQSHFSTTVCLAVLEFGFILTLLSSEWVSTQFLFFPSRFSFYDSSCVLSCHGSYIASMLEVSRVIAVAVFWVGKTVWGSILFYLSIFNLGIFIGSTQNSEIYMPRSLPGF